MANIQKSVSDNLSKTFAQDNGLALRASSSLADNEVFSNTKLKSDMDAYSKAHSIADKYSENYSKTNSDSVSFASKVMPEVTKQFIANDERLSAMYESGDIRAAKNALDEASKRIDTAYKSGVGADYNDLNSAFSTVTGFDARGNLADKIDQNINDGKNLDSNVNNQVANGQNNISSNNVSNTIDQDPDSQYNLAKSHFKEASSKDMDTHNSDVALGMDKHIEKGGDTIQERKDDFTDDSRMGKSFVAVGDGIKDVGKGIENLDKALGRIETHGSDGVQEMKNSEKNWDNNMDKLFDKSQGTNSTSTADIAEVKTQLSYLKDDIEDSQYQQPQAQIQTKKEVK
jgi:conjugal transfer mating pair stabilization protein TraG